jgi:excisionase family DNA binding protein
MMTINIKAAVRDALLKPEQVAEILGVTPETLQVWRSTRRYPLPYVKVGRCVRYRMSDVEAFLQQQTVAC